MNNRIATPGGRERGDSVVCYLGRQDGGDARQAITLLRKAGDLARAENADSVMTDHVECAQEKLEAQQSMDIIRDLTEHEQLTLMR